MPLPIETVRELIKFGRFADRECGLDCPGFVTMERNLDGLIEIERCDQCCTHLKNGMQLFDDDVQQLPEARLLFRRERAEMRALEVDNRVWGAFQGRKAFMRKRSQARAALHKTPKFWRGYREVEVNDQA